jgi:4-hydroxybenzoate polyprenyltransferase
MTPEFSYMGNSIEDYVLFEHATESYLVAPTRAAKRKTFTKMLDQQEQSTILLLLKELRVYQWVKNLLLLVPLFVGNAYTNMSLVLACVVGFFAFSLLASATYVLNDLVDLDEDRGHQRKKYRPIASGDLSIIDGVLTAVALLFISAALALSISVEFSMVLLVYLALTLSYSLKLKHYFAMDVIILASLYTIRILPERR